MKNLTSIPNDLLHNETLQAAANEKAATLILLEHLAEVDRRRLYAMRGYSSLWEYVCKALTYSESQAYERVSAMRLMMRVPEVKVGLQSGKLTLTTAAKLGTHAKREKLRADETLSLLNMISGKTSREVERMLLAHSTEPRNPEHVRAISPGRTRITIEVEQRFLELAQKVRDLKGNPALSFQEVFETAMQEYVTRRAPKACAVLGAPKVEARQKPRIINPKIASRYIPANVRTIVRVRSNERCKFVDPLTKRRCGSTSGLQFDHIRPFAKGGGHLPENLRRLCRAHNMPAAIAELGREKMEPFLRY